MVQALLGTVDRALEVAGGAGFYRSAHHERCFRDRYGSVRSSSTYACASYQLVDLDQVPARVREDGHRDGPHPRRLLREDDAGLLEALGLGGDVARHERGEGDPLIEHRLL